MYGGNLESESKTVNFWIGPHDRVDGDDQQVYTLPERVFEILAAVSDKHHYLS
jgi:hypothetical protein